MMDTKAANRIYAKRHRARRKRDQRLLRSWAEKDWLDQLEVRGYLHPDRRGERADECDAIEAFLADSLTR